MCGITQSYRPEQVLVADEQPDDVSRASGHSELLLFTDLTAEALAHEDVGRHHHCNIVQRHLIPVLMVSHSLEELQQSLKDTERPPEMTLFTCLCVQTHQSTSLLSIFSFRLSLFPTDTNMQPIRSAATEWRRGLLAYS